MSILVSCSKVLHPSQGSEVGPVPPPLQTDRHISFIDLASLACSLTCLGIDVPVSVAPDHIWG